MKKITSKEYHENFRCNRENIFDSASYLSKSAISEFADSSPFIWRYYPKRYTTLSMAHGSLIDCLTTTPEDFDKEYVISEFADFKKKEAREWRDAQTKIVLKREQLEQAEIAVGMLLNKNKITADIFKSSKKQVALICDKKKIQASGAEWCDVNLKGLVDLAPVDGPCLVDLKTINDLSMSGIQRAIAKFNYHAQAGLYLTLWNIENPDDIRTNFKFIFQSSSFPYEVAVVELSAIEINLGKDYIKNNILMMQDLAKNNEWPMLFGSKVPVVSRPEWAVRQEEQRYND